MQTYLIKDRAHPGATDSEKSAEYKMSGNRWRIRKVSEYITGPEIEKHGYNKANEPVLANVQGEILNKFEPPGKKETDAREKNSKQEHTEHAKVFDVRINSFIGRRMDIDQKCKYVRTDQKRMKQYCKE